MKCEYHPDAEAVEGCVRCQRLICERCLNVYEGSVYCRQCLAELQRGPGRRYSSPYPRSVAEAGITTPARRRSGLGNTILILTLLVLVASGIMVYRIVGKDEPPAAAEVGSYAQSTFVDVQPPILKVTGEQVKLTNNPQAVNPSFAELKEFLKKDPTDSLPYIIGQRMCAAFAETIHNNAELAGIRAAFVGVDIAGRPVGHALNAFETTDMGMVYVDCVGPEPDAAEGPQPSDYDKIAYVVEGQPYGTISMNRAGSLEYSFYRSHDRRWDECEQTIADYNRDVALFNEEVKNRVFDEGSEEAAEIGKWKDELDRQKEEIEVMLTGLGNYRFTSPGTVEEITLYW